MHDFWNALESIDKTIYQPNNLQVTSVIEEEQNSDYGAGRFTIGSSDISGEPLGIEVRRKSVRLRVAKITPKKTGQFVTFWQKDNENKNQTYHWKASPDLLVIHTLGDNQVWGQFVFPKDILLEKNILRSDLTTGKMAMRVYPFWDKPSSNAAIATQKWQSDYFFQVLNEDILPITRILSLYHQ